jgi:hypothetical protein
VEEFLAVLPPPLARGLVAVGKKLNPSGMQLVAVKKDLHEDPTKGNETVYTPSKNQQLVQVLTAGLKPYGLALAIATVVWLLTTLITPTYRRRLHPIRSLRVTKLTRCFFSYACAASRRFFGYPYLYMDFAGIFSASWAILLWGGETHMRFPSPNRRSLTHSPMSVLQACCRRLCGISVAVTSGPRGSPSS